MYSCNNPFYLLQHNVLFICLSILISIIVIPKLTGTREQTMSFGSIYVLNFYREHRELPMHIHDYMHIKSLQKNKQL